MNLDIELKDMVYDNDSKNHKLKIENSYTEVKYFKEKADFTYDLEYLVSFIKKIEALVRKDSRYTEYKNQLYDKGFNKCAVLGNIDVDKADIEMHHGPILTLFDIVFVILNHKLNKGKKVTTFRIAKDVIDAHYDNLIQIVMLSTSVHEQDHDNTGFISMRQCCAGNIIDFLLKYEEGLTQDHKGKIMDYLVKSQKYDSNFGDVFELDTHIKTWK